jgi:PAS domain S-box-containing protein
VTDLGDGWKIGGEEFVAGVLQATAQPIWVVDPDGLIQFANPAAVEALGYGSAEELLGRQSHETIHYEHPDGTPYPASECPMLLPRKTGETVRSELDWFFRRDGSRFPVSYVSVPLPTAAGRGAVVAFTDIEERLRAEQALRDREAGLSGQQAALRRVAALVASDTAPADLFTAVAREVGQVLSTPIVQMSRYEPDGTATVIGVWSERPHPFQTGTRWPLEGPTITLRVRQTGQPARLDDLARVPGVLADAVRETGIRSVAGAPIVVNGRVWGLMVTGSTEGRPLPAGIEHRLAEFTELVATAISNAQAREDLQGLAEEQAALRRVATVVAQGAPPTDVFAAVAAECAGLLGITRVVMCRYEPDNTATAIGAAGEHPFRPGTNWPLDGPSMLATVKRTGRPARIDDYASLPGPVAQAVRTINANAGVSAPIIVDGEVWGVVSVGADSALPPDTEDRLTQFTDLVATAISKTQASEELRQLAEEQAALRRVATLVAEGAPPTDVFGAVAAEVAVLLDLPLVEMCRFDPDGTASVIGAVGEHPFQAGTNWALDGPSLPAEVKRTGRPARVDDYADLPGSMRAAARAAGVHAGVGAPIIVDGQVWGAVSAGGGAAVRLLPDAELRLSQFTELVATAIANAQAREERRQLADEQAALRRIATLVAEGSDSQRVFDAVCEETGRLFGAATVNLVYFTPDDFHLAVAGWSLRGVHVPAGTRLPLKGETIDTLVRRTAAPGRFDSYEQSTGELAALIRKLGVRSEVGAPVVVDGDVWGVLIAGTDEPEPLPAGTEYRLASFAELIATAVSNTTARSELIASRARIVAAGDEQRRRVVRDLHDGAQQRLVHALITLQLAAGEGGIPPEPARLVDEALEDTRHAIDELRELAHGLHPAVLTARGLAAAVEELADRAPVPVHIDVPEQRYPAVIESAAYFIAAEALTNVAKYANASKVTVTARISADSLVLDVDDDGVGGAVVRPGSGLSGLLDRAAALDGTLSVESPSGAGTRLRAQLPLPPPVPREPVVPAGAAQV